MKTSLAGYVIMFELHVTPEHPMFHPMSPPITAPMYLSRDGEMYASHAPRFQATMFSTKNEALKVIRRLRKSQAANTAELERLNGKRSSIVHHYRLLRVMSS